VTGSSRRKIKQLEEAGEERRRMKNKNKNKSKKKKKK
jgi:hypothetical protein